jgi:manganese-dependent inorganic pyrophosphatase
MQDKIYIIGHKSPDLDSVAGAIAYAELKNKLENTNKYQAVAAGEMNKETAFILNKISMIAPEIITNISKKDVILVDHNEFIQAVDGVEEANIIEVLDHHKVDFRYSKPIAFKVLPWGASCSIVAHGYLSSNVAIDKNMALLMLSAILVDTVITKSPTCTDFDKAIIEKLSQIAEIQNWQDFGMEIFKVRSDVNKLSDDGIIKSDFKDFVLKTGKFGIGQVETVDLNDFAGREDDLIAGLEKIRTEGAYHSVVLFLTDIIKEGSLFLVSSLDEDKLAEALGQRLVDHRVYIDGILSRKKQVAPKFNEVFDK